MKKTFFLKAISSFICFIVLSFVQNVNAVDVEPSKMEITVVSGTQSETAFKLTNRTHDILGVTISTGEYRFMLTENSTPPSGKTPSEVLKSCETWIVPELKNATVNPGESKNITFKINVPSGVKGEYAACILFDQASSIEKDSLLDNDTKEKLMDFEVDLVYRRAVPVYLFIKDSSEIKGIINNITVGDMLTEDLISQNTINNKNQIKFTIDFQNTGTKHTRAKGSILILDSQGSIIDTISTGKSLPIFPEFQEKIPVYWECPKKADTYSAVITLDLGDNVILQSEKSFSLDEKGFLIK